MKNPIATIHTQQGQITLELYPEQAPNTVNSFLWLAKQGLLDNRPIRRIVPGFVIQPSYSDFDDPRCAYSIAGEYRLNGFDNTIPFCRGTVAMGGEGKIASGSCFFITLTDAAGERLDGKFAAFGRVLSGWEEIDRLTHVPLRPVPIPDAPGVTVNEPVTPEYITRVVVDTFGADYPEPVKLEE